MQNITKSLPRFDEYLSKNHIYKILFATFVILEFYFMYVDWGPFPPRNYLALALSSFSIIDLLTLRLKELIKRYEFLILLILMFSGNLLLHYIFRGEFLFKFYLKYILKFGTIVCSLTFLIPRVKNSTVAYTIIFTAGLSLLIAVFQKLGFDFAYDIRRFISEKEFTSLMIRPGSSRPPGLAFYTLTLSEQLYLLLPIILYKFRTIKIDLYKKWTLLLLIGFSLLNINNRGVTLAFLIFLIFLEKETIKRFSWKIKLFISLTILPIFYSLRHKVRLLNFEKSNDTYRIDALVSSLIVLKNNFWLGLGENYSKVTELMKNSQESMPFIFRPEKLGIVGPHNFFINMHLKFGLLGTLIVVFIFYRLIQQCRKSEYLTLYLIITTISSMVHNGGILNTTTLALGMMIFYFFENENFVNS